MIAVWVGAGTGSNTPRAQRHRRPRRARRTAAFDSWHVCTRNDAAYERSGPWPGSNSPWPRSARPAGGLRLLAHKHLNDVPLPELVSPSDFLAAESCVVAPELRAATLGAEVVVDRGGEFRNGCARFQGEGLVFHFAVAA